MKSNKLKLFIGLAISLFFLFLAFRKVDFGQMVQAFAEANYFYLCFAVGVMIFSHWLRAYRWGFLIKPIHPVGTSPLFNALIIGYMFNVFLPAHLGEFVRAYVLGRKEPVQSSAVFGTIVIERIIDVFSLLIIFALTIIVFPFEEAPWVKTSGYLSFIFIIILFGILVFMKKYRELSLKWLGVFTKPFPAKFASKIDELVHSFLDGIVPLKHWTHYGIVIVISILMWVFYALAFQIVFYAFNFVAIYSLPWFAALVLLVITTISILVPSSPGYVGTYHYLCMLSLGLFAVPDSPALSFAVLMHGLNFLPVLVLGLVIVSIEGLSIKGIQGSVETS